MKTLFIDPETRDLAFDLDNSLVMVEDQEEEKQSLRQLVGTNLGEWFLNESGHGLRYNQIQVKNPDADVIAHEVRQSLAQEPRAKEVLAVDVAFDRQKRHLEISYRVRMESGNVIEDKVVV